MLAAAGHVQEAEETGCSHRPTRSNLRSRSLASSMIFRC